MPLYLVTFTEHGGYRCQCRIRAAVGADHLTLAVRKIWGDSAVWVWAPGAQTAGRVYVQVGEDEDDLHPKTGLTTVEVQPAARRRHVP
jgi:hypothetical protein